MPLDLSLFVSGSSVLCVFFQYLLCLGVVDNFDGWCMGDGTIAAPCAVLSLNLLTMDLTSLNSSACLLFANSNLWTISVGSSISLLHIYLNFQFVLVLHGNTLSYTPVRTSELINSFINRYCMNKLKIMFIKSSISIFTFLNPLLYNLSKCKYLLFSYLVCPMFISSVCPLISCYFFRNLYFILFIILYFPTRSSTGKGLCPMIMSLILLKSLPCMVLLENLLICALSCNVPNQCSHFLICPL